MADFAAEVERFRAAKGLTLRGLAKAINYDPSLLSKVLNGHKPPNPRLTALLDSALGADGAIIAAAREQEQSASMVQAARAVSDLAAHAIEFTVWAETANAGDGTMQLLDDQLNGIAREYLSSPPLPLIERAADISSTVFGMLQQRQRLRHVRDLYLTGAKAHAFLSWAAGDLGQLAAATTHGRTALTLATEAGHRGVQAIALSALSKTAYWDGQPRAALELAQRGYQAAPANSTRALLACQVADASGPPTAIEAVSAARDALRDATEDDDIGGVFACGPTRIGNYAIGVYLRADDPDRALQAAAAVLPPQPGELVGYGTRGQIAIGCADARLRQHDLPGAVQEITPVLELPPEQRLTTVTGRLVGLAAACDAAAASGAGRQAADIAAQIRDCCRHTAASAAAALPPGKDPE